MLEILTPAEMAAADQLAAAEGCGFQLMLNAGAAVAASVLRRYPAAARIHILCGPGNNGGDGYVAARILAESGCPVLLWREQQPRPGGDAERAAAECPLLPMPVADFDASAGDLVVDAFYGAGLSRPVEGAEAEAIARATAAGCPALAIDLPSGLDGASGRPTGRVLAADATVTFVRKKPAHLLQPGRALCGDIEVCDIGVSPETISRVGCLTWEDAVGLWRAALPRPAVDAHKYARGHVGVFSGGPFATGAARLSAVAAARAGAGAVTVLSPNEAMAANAAHLTSIMLKRVDGLGDLDNIRENRPGGAFVLGPGFGVGERACAFALHLLDTNTTSANGIVLDADAITSFAADPDPLFAAIGREGAPPCVLTPHEGEFRRMFPDLGENAASSKLHRAREAARRSGAIVILKGPDTVIAAPDGRAAINANGSPFLATAGSGDVLAGLAAGLLAQRMPAFEASCAAVWLHAECAQRLGAGLIAEDLPAALPLVLRDLYADQASPGRG